MCDFLSIIRQLEQLRRGEIITEQEVKELCTKAREILIEESNVQRVDAPVTVNTCYFELREHGVNSLSVSYIDLWWHSW